MLREAKGKRWVCRVCQITNEAEEANIRRESGNAEQFQMIETSNPGNSGA